MSAHSSQGSADSTTDSPEPGSRIGSSVNPTSGDERCSPTTGPESLSSRTFVRSTRPHGPVESELNDERWEEADTHPTLTPNGTTQNALVAESPSTTTFVKSHRGAGGDDPDIPSLNGMDLRYPSNPPLLISSLPIDSRIAEDIAPTLQAAKSPNRGGTAGPLIFSAAASPAKTSQSPETGQGSQATDPASSSSSPASSTLFDPDGYSWKTFPDCSPRTLVGTSESLLERWPTSGIAWATGFSTAATSECHSDEDGCSSSQPSLTEILEEPQNVPARYSLSARAATGILRRAHKRGRELPPHLMASLQEVSSGVGRLDPA